MQVSLDALRPFVHALLSDVLCHSTSATSNVSMRALNAFLEEALVGCGLPWPGSRIGVLVRAFFSTSAAYSGRVACVRLAKARVDGKSCELYTSVTLTAANARRASARRLLVERDTSSLLAIWSSAQFASTSTSSSSSSSSSSSLSSSASKRARVSDVLNGLWLPSVAALLRRVRSELMNASASGCVVVSCSRQGNATSTKTAHGSTSADMDTVKSVVFEFLSDVVVHSKSATDNVSQRALYESLARVFAEHGLRWPGKKAGVFVREYFVERFAGKTPWTRLVQARAGGEVLTVYTHVSLSLANTARTAAQALLVKVDTSHLATQWTSQPAPARKSPAPARKSTSSKRPRK